MMLREPAGRAHPGPTGPDRRTNPAPGSAHPDHPARDSRPGLLLLAEVDRAPVGFVVVSAFDEQDIGTITYIRGAAGAPPAGRTRDRTAHRRRRRAKHAHPVLTLAPAVPAAATTTPPPKTSPQAPSATPATTPPPPRPPRHPHPPLPPQTPDRRRLAARPS